MEYGVRAGLLGLERAQSQDLGYTLSHLGLAFLLANHMWLWIT